MGWSRALLVPHVVRLGLRAPREVSTRWDRYWAGVRATGDGGDVLWDSSRPDEARRYLDLLGAHADPRLPVIDLGCGNGRLTRALATRYPRALGVDLSPAAIARAEHETIDHQDHPDRPGDPDPTSDPAGPGVGGVGAAGPEFRAADMTVDGVGGRLAAELGDANVFIRGVLHVLDAPARRRLATNVHSLVGTTGTVLVAETNYPGPPLGYLESLGAGPRGLPHPLARAVASGLPRPQPFGVAELEDCFSPARWDRVLVDDHAEITAIPMQRANVPESIPALVAVLRPRGLPASLHRSARTHPALS